MARKLPKFVNGWVDAYGTVYHYVRVPGRKPVRLPGLPWSSEFMAAYAAVIADEPLPVVVPREIGASKTVDGTVNALVVAFLDCSPRSTSPFKTLAPETQRKWRNDLERFREQHGDKRIYRTKPNGSREMLLRREKVQQLVNEKSATPFAQRNFLIVLRVLFRWALNEGRIPEDPTVGVERLKVKSTGHQTWSEAEIEKFQQRHPVGSRARLALSLLLYTGLRRSDVIRLGRQHIRNGIISIDQDKTEGVDEAHLEIPVHPQLQKTISATPSKQLTFLVNDTGRPWSPGGFGNWFRSCCKEAGLKGLSAHGLRKACARRLAEAGCSAHQIASITGHASITEVQRYAQAADRKRLAREAIQRLVDAENLTCKRRKNAFRARGDK
jgi:integrase